MIIFSGHLIEINSIFSSILYFVYKIIKICLKDNSGYDSGSMQVAQQFRYFSINCSYLGETSKNLAGSLNLFDYSIAIFISSIFKVNI